MSLGLKTLIKESLSRIQSLKDIQLMSLAKSLSVLSPEGVDAFPLLRSEARRRGRILDESRKHTLSGVDQGGVTVAWENPACMVLDKPQGVVVSLDGDLSRTGTTNLAPTGKSPELNRILPQVFPGVPIFTDPLYGHGILHRLDRDTTGALLVARTFEAFFDLRLQFAAGKVGKEYVCLVEGKAGKVGKWQSINTRIETSKYIDADKHVSFQSRTVGAGGEHAQTDFTPVAIFKSKQNPDNLISLIRVKLLTGRTHQIRVHMASEGLPLLFDDKYGNKNSSAKFFLHARRLSFLDPQRDSEEPSEVEVTIPSHMRVFIDSELDLVEGTSPI